MPRNATSKTADHPRTHRRVLVNFLPHELKAIDDYLTEVSPGRENRSEFLRDAAMERLQSARRFAKKSEKPT